MSKLSTLTIASLAALCLAGPAAAEKLYKWVDEDGNVHYSDQVPPDQVEQAREEFNEQGVVVNRVDRAPTDEERAAQEAARKAAEEQARQLEEQRREDRKIMAIYASEQDIIRSKEQQLESIDRAIEAARAFVQGQGKSLASLLERAARQEDAGEEVGQALKNSIAAAQEQIRVQEEFIAEKEAERAATEDYYAGELARYREIQQRIEARAAKTDSG